MNIERSPARLDRTLLALADPTRRALLSRLSRGESRVTDLAAPFDISLNSVSKHLRVLESARLVRRRRLGREHWLTLDTSPLDEVARWIDTHSRLWAGRLDALGALLDAEDRAAGQPPRAPAPKKGKKR